VTDLLAASRKVCSLPHAHRGSPWLTDLLATTLFLALGLGLVLRPYTTQSGIPGDLADQRFNLSMLEFFSRTVLDTLRGRPANFLDAPFFYPWPRVTNFSDTFWGSGEIYALVRALGADSLASFQIWFVAGFVLTYMAAFASFRSLSLRTWGAAAGAFLFTFCLPMADQFYHGQLVYRLWVPLAVVAFDHFLTRRSLRAAVACLLFVALQLLASIYLGLFLCLLLASYAVALCLFARSRLAPPTWASFRSASGTELIILSILLAAGLAVLAIVGIPYFDVQSMYGFTRSWDQVAEMLPRPGSYLLTRSSKLWPDLSASFPYPNVWEHRIFPGLAAIIPLAWFLVWRRARARQPLAASMLATVGILFAVTIDLDGHTFYRLLIYPIPGFSAIRAVTRIILVMMLPVAALFGMLIDDLAAGRAGLLPRYPLALALSVLLAAECSLINQYSTQPSDWRGRLDALQARLPKQLPRDAILAIKTEPKQPGVDWPWLLTQTDADMVAATLGISTLNGYSGNSPPTWKSMTTCGDITDNLRAGRHFLMEHAMLAPDITNRLVLVGFGDCTPAGFAHDPLLQLGRTYDFAQGADGNEFLADGFSYPESWGRWTDAENAFLFFSLSTVPSTPVSVAIRASSLSPAADREQAALVSANGHVCGQLVVTSNQPNALVTCPAGALRVGDNMLRLNVARPTRPSELGVDADERRLGLGLQTMTLMPIATP
jgi:hypothetical protein